MADKDVVIDKIKWWVKTDAVGGRHPTPICPEHHLRMVPDPERISQTSRVLRPARTATKLKCAEGPHFFDIPRNYGDEETYVVDRIDAEVFAKRTYIYLDDVAVPVALDKIGDKEDPIWVRAKVTESKSGLRLIVWAGDKSAKTKAQLFVEPELKRLGFDQNDDHPLEVFAKVEATFADGISTTIERSSPKK